MKVLAIEGGASRELLSYAGLVIVHDGDAARRELEFLFPKYRDGQVRFVEVDLVEGTHLSDGRPTMWLRDHPDMDMVRWPLREEDFVQLRGTPKHKEHEIIAAGIHKAATQEPSPRQKREWYERHGLLIPE